MYNLMSNLEEHKILMLSLEGGYTTRTVFIKVSALGSEALDS